MTWDILSGIPIRESEMLRVEQVLKTGPPFVDQLQFWMHPLMYTKFAAMCGSKPRYASNGKLGLIFHRSRKKAMRATGMGQCWVVSKTGKTLARRRIREIVFPDSIPMADTTKLVWDVPQEEKL